jgi:UDP-N-acetylmuramoyl-tripeptide--D-alanyl-D-alanine ligase
MDDILAATGGGLACGSREALFTGIGIDSRQLPDGSLFVAIKGDRHDGHGFVEAVISTGCRGVLVDRDRLGPLPLEKWGRQGVACISVPDTTVALGNLATYHLERSGASVVAVTGSNGKTSTREMTAAVVGRRFSTLSSAKNFNNEIGVPLTLLRLMAGHEWVVAELGMNHPGEIRRLGRICRPRVGVITNIGPAHLEGLGSMDAIMAAKGELLETLPPEGTAVLNLDDPRCRELAGKASVTVLGFGMGPSAGIRAEGVHEEGRCSRFTLHLPDGAVPVTLAVPGRFMVSNALAAAAVGYCLGVPAAEIKAGLEAFQPVAGRSMIVDTAAGIHVIDDTYNANPGSMRAAITLLADLGRGRRCFLALGDMRELGDLSAALHREIGAAAARSGLFRLGVTGAFAGEVAEGALSGGMGADRILVGSREELAWDFKQHLAPGDWVLAKGSRAMGMEKLVEDLVAWAGGRAVNDER